jgi:N-acetylmuramoyl-L-alanine amidase
MAEPDRMKRRLVREAVQENLDTLQGVRRPPARRPERGTWLRSGLFLLTPAALFGASLLIHTPQRSSAVEPAPVPAERRLLAPEPAPTVTLASSLPAPAALDPAVFALAVRRVVLDPGHGGRSRGAEAPGGLLEKELTLDIAERLRSVLERESFEVSLTRDRDTDIDLDDRAALANRETADIFVSIHLNWFAGGSNRGVETYYLGPTADPFLKVLAESENRDSGYSLADFRRLLEGVYTGVRSSESRRLAESVQGELYRSLRAVNPALQDRGVKTAPFIVLVGTGMPAILAEVSCLSSEEETALLKDPAYRQRIADALAAGINGYARAVSNGEQKGS